MRLIAVIKSTTADRARHAANVRWGNEQAHPAVDFSEKEERAIATLARRVFLANQKNFERNDYEFSIPIYSANGVARLGKLVVGDESEVRFDDKDDIVAAVHSHPNGLPELSVWDEETGNEVSIKTGRQFRIYAIGYDDGKTVMGYEDFFPDNETPDDRKQELLHTAYDDYLKHFSPTRRSPKPLSIKDFESVW